MSEEKNQSVFASLAILLVGIWVGISPLWISVTGGALASVIATGAVIALAGLIQLFWEVTLPSWVSGVAAAWLFASVFVFSVGTGAVWSQILSAVVVFLLSSWDGYEVATLHERKTHTHAV